MDAERARAFAMPDTVKIEYVRQADARRYKFGARVYRLFATWAAWEHYQRDEAERGREVA
jgi:hypothetical protein